MDIHRAAVGPGSSSQRSEKHEALSEVFRGGFDVLGSTDRIGSWKRGAAASGERQETRAGRDSRAKEGTRAEFEIYVDATSSELASQANSGNPGQLGRGG